MVYFSCLVILSLLLSYVSNSAEVLSLVARLRRPETPEEYYMSDENSFNNGETVTFGSSHDTMYFAARFGNVSSGQKVYIKVSTHWVLYNDTSSVETIDKPYSIYRFMHGSSYMRLFTDDINIHATVYLMESNGQLIDSKRIIIWLNVVSPVVSSISASRMPPGTSIEYDASYFTALGNFYPWKTSNNIYTFVDNDSFFVLCAFDNMYYGYSTNIEIMSSNGISSESGEETLIGDYNMYWRFYQYKSISTLGNSGTIDTTCIVYDTKGNKVASNDFSFAYSAIILEYPVIRPAIGEAECKPTVSTSDVTYESERVRCMRYKYVPRDCFYSECKREMLAIAPPSFL